MNGRYLLDTNVAIQVLNGQLDLESRSGRGIKLFLCLTVIGELFFGAAKSGKPKPIGNVSKHSFLCVL